MFQKIERLILFGMIIGLPFMNLPKSFSIPYLGGNISKWFLVIGVAILIWEYIIFPFKIPSLAKKYFVIFTGWQILCLIIGLIEYEFPHYLRINELPSLYSILEKWQSLRAIPDIVAVKFWLFLRYTKEILVVNCQHLIIAFFIWHLYNDNYTKAFEDFRKAGAILVGLLGFYSIFELSWLKFGSRWGEAVLREINPHLYEIGHYNGWWPPILWNNGLRSLMEEPSLFGIVSVFLMPFLWTYIKSNKGENIGSWIVNNGYWLLFIGYFMVMLFATNSRTAVIIFICELILLTVGTIIAKTRNQFIRTMCVFVLATSAFCINLVNFQRTSGGESASSKVLTKQYINRTVTSVSEKGKYSNNARLANLIAHLNTLREYPFMGTGTGLIDLYLDRNIPSFAYSNHEVRNWSRYLHMEGIFKSNFPALNKYMSVATQNGLVGFLLFLYPYFYIIHIIWELRKKLK